MPQDIPIEIFKQFLKAVKVLQRMQTDLRLIIPAITIENPEDSAEVDVVHYDLNGKIIESYKVGPGNRIVLTEPRRVGRTADPQLDEVEGEELHQPGAVPLDKIKWTGGPRPGAEYKIKTEWQGEFFKVGLSKKAKPGEQAIIKLENLRDDPLDLLTTIPDDYPWGSELPHYHKFGSVKPHHAQEIEMTRQLNDNNMKQTILYYSSRETSNTILERPFITLI